MATRRLYPPTKFSQANSLADQVAHILSEIDEAAVEMEAVNLSGAIVGHAAFHNLEQLLPLLRELGDVQASIETLWGVVDRIFGEGTSEREVLEWIEEKNRDRGYYIEKSEEVPK